MTSGNTTWYGEALKASKECGSAALESMGVISWRDVVSQGAAMSVVEHGKVWANSSTKSWLKGRAIPFDNKNADNNSTHNAKVVGRSILTWSL